MKTKRSNSSPPQWGFERKPGLRAGQRQVELVTAGSALRAAEKRAAGAALTCGNMGTTQAVGAPWVTHPQPVLWASSPLPPGCVSSTCSILSPVSPQRVKVAVM